MAVSKIEKIILLLLTIIVWIVLALYAGAPIFSDEFMYIDIGLRSFKEPSYGNRYFHVYLQKIFMELAPTPLQGTRFFWAFLIAATAAMLYYNARTLLRDSTPLHGLLALAFFFSFPMIVLYSGEPAVDITAMFMVSWILSVYLFALRNPQKKNLSLVILGTLAFLSFKTKETTLFVNFLLLGFAFDDQDRFQWQLILKMVKPLLVGLLIGVGVFMLLDWIVLGDPFFGINPATFTAVFTHYDFGKVFYDLPQSWYREFFLDELLLAFLLYLVSAFSLKHELPIPLKLVWVYPFIMAVFVTLNMIKIPWGVIERFYFPALPVLAMLAPQFLRFKFPQTARAWLAFTLLVCAAGALILGLRAFLLKYASAMDFAYASLLDSLYYPVLLTILLAFLFWMKRFSWAAAVVPLFCIGAMLLSPLMNNAKYYFLHQRVNQRYAQIMLPFKEFSSVLQLGDADKLYVSASLDRDRDMLSDDPNDVVAMYNFYFDRRIQPSNVRIAYDRISLLNRLQSGQISFALITVEDFAWLQEHAGQWQKLQEKYQVIPDLQGKTVMLQLK